MTRRQVVAVFGSGKESHAALAIPVGSLVAELGASLLTGGGSGVMASACRAYAECPTRRGQSIGVLPDVDRDDYPNEWVDVAIRTHLSAKGRDGLDPASRNHINVLSADAAIALPGSEGTESELQLCVHYGRPILAFGWTRDRLPDGCESVPIAEDLSDVRAFLLQTLPALDKENP